MSDLSLLEIVIAVMTTYRVAQLIVVDDGPYGVFDRVRRWLGRKGAQAQRDEKWTIWRNLAELVHCPYCVGVWIAAGVTWALGPADATEFIVIALAIAGGQAFLEAMNGE